MMFRDLRLLADESLDPLLVHRLQVAGVDIQPFSRLGAPGLPDSEVLARANAEQRAVITHDADFGALVFSARQPSSGIIYIRPGHIDATFHYPTIDALLAIELVSDRPLMIVASRSEHAILIRQRPIHLDV